ncbi:MAG: DUF4846 domain-containing protein, partial [Oscillospiraceae bacterium]|nr:DUF4846 domain-containing protein [Oscillospiraceae bacterium]
TPPTPTPPPIKVPTGATLQTRFHPPHGYVRTEADAGSFGAYLRALPLKGDGSRVLFYDGTERGDAPQAAVVSLSIDRTPLQQGPRAMVRLRAEYLYASGQTELIVYHFLSGFTFPFSKWCEGYRVEVDGSDVEWVSKGDPSDPPDYDALLHYLATLFIYCNTQSMLLMDLVPASDMRQGDVFINKSSGAVMVVDTAVNEDTGDVVFMLAQSPMPTQEIYILQNRLKPALSPWYSMADLYPLLTPGDGSFESADLVRFNEQEPPTSDN